MTDVAIFHSVLGVRRGVRDAAVRLEEAGHRVTVIDQYEGRTFDDYERAGAFAAEVGFPTLMQRAVEGVANIPDGFVALGFSNGGGMATYVATQRQVGRAILCSGALPLERIQIERWPSGVPVQLHYTVGDPFKTPGSVESVMASVNAAGLSAEYFQYPGNGHLFTDADRAGEFDSEASTQFWSHVIRFIASSR